MAAPYQTTNIDQLHNGLIPTPAAALYTNSSSTAKVQIVDVIIHNPYSGSQSVIVELWLVPSAGSISDTNKLLYKDIRSNHTLAFKLPIIMKPGAAIYGRASVNNVTNIFLNGIEFDKDA